jgi:hypothetical protein
MLLVRRPSLTIMLSISLVFLASIEAFYPQVGWLDTGGGPAGGEFVTLCPTPHPLSPPSGAVLSNRDWTAGRGANLVSIHTRGGGRCAPLPRATICSPFRAEKRLAVSLSAIPCVQQKREELWDMIRSREEGAVNSYLRLYFKTPDRSRVWGIGVS